MIHLNSEKGFVMRSNKMKVIDILKDAGYLENTVSKTALIELFEKKSIPFPQWITKEFYRVGRGEYNLSSLKTLNFEKDLVKEYVGKDDRQDFIPRVRTGYVPFGHFDDIEQIISRKIFYPGYVTGLSGNGKTTMIEQICAKLGRELIRANITGETDEDDLFGGFRIRKNETVWEDGPVITAMERGAILLLDEVDLGSPKLMCLQPVLEGSGVFIKKINRMVYPKAGFNIFATANTKGRGSSDGMFVGTMIMNEAFLERFAITFEQDYPSKQAEQEILFKEAERLGIPNDNYLKHIIDALTKWAEITRTSYKNGSLDVVITTRRLVHVMSAYAIWSDILKSLKLALARFTQENAESLFDMYTKIDDQITAAEKQRKIEEERKIEAERLKKIKEEEEEAKKKAALANKIAMANDPNANPLKPLPSINTLRAEGESKEEFDKKIQGLIDNVLLNNAKEAAKVSGQLTDI
jgi:MoxR-like ATPase